MSIDISNDHNTNLDDDIQMTEVDPVAKILPSLEELLVCCFTASFYVLFEEEYGSEWRTLVPEEPWSIHHIIGLLKSEWHTVFEPICSNGLYSKLDKMLRVSKDIARMNDIGLASITVGDLNQFIIEIEKFLVICDAAKFPNDRFTALHHLQNFRNALNI